MKVIVLLTALAACIAALPAIPHSGQAQTSADESYLPMRIRAETSADESYLPMKRAETSADESYLPMRRAETNADESYDPMRRAETSADESYDPMKRAETSADEWVLLASGSLNSDVSLSKRTQTRDNEAQDHSGSIANTELLGAQRDIYSRLSPNTHENPFSTGLGHRLLRRGFRAIHYFTPVSNSYVSSSWYRLQLPKIVSFTR
ncbi:uncharacterized protein CLUP02_07107 [Colletotrichum lupini]|uniref:Uncharacterized protein n=1 Tax=Colletotrichum lupini TaxID=145971 RepID=A0A9Q8WFR7_9PEZI|nr:uncharacterized protein CLUP02_07107 [Colletotrichum lupini]UQC81621.1 hypothetical protein CLUP02_07107 [Colletotrichum lupini]